MNPPLPAPIWQRQLATLLDLIMCVAGVLIIAQLVNLIAKPIFAHLSKELASWMRNNQVTEFEHIISDADESRFAALPSRLRTEFDTIESQIEFVCLALVCWFLWFYHAYLEAKTGTPGKLAFGLAVRRLTGDRFSLTHATIRFIGKILLTGIVFVFVGIPMIMLGGWMIPGGVDGRNVAAIAAVCYLFIVRRFSRRSQALHDWLSGSIVVKVAKG